MIYMLNTSVTQQNNRWTKPSPHACMLKCCIDAAMFEEEKLRGFGICIWDNMGILLVQKFNGNWDICPPVHEAEG